MEIDSGYSPTAELEQLIENEEKIDFFEMGLNYSKSSELKLVIDDVADMLGYSHA